MSSPLPNLNPILHQPLRTQIVAFLSSRGEATFIELKHALGSTDGNLGAHLNKLVEAGMIASQEIPGGSKPQQVFVLTEIGRTALAEYVAQLSQLLQFQSYPQALSDADPITFSPSKPQEIV